MLKCVHSVPAFGSLNGPTERLGSWCQTNPKLQRASKRASFWFLKKAITCSHLLMQPLAAATCHTTTCRLAVWQQVAAWASGCHCLPAQAATCSGHLQPLAATCSHLQPLPQAATCSYKQPLATTCPSSHLQSLAATATGCIFENQIAPLPRPQCKTGLLGVASSERHVYQTTGLKWSEKTLHATLNMVSRPKTGWDKDRDHCLHGRSTHSTATGYVFFSVRCISQSSAAAYLQRPAVCLPLVRTWIGVDIPQKNQFLVGYYIDVYYIYIVCYVYIYMYIYIYILSPFYGEGTYPKM